MTAAAPRVLVAIPAHNEEERISDCLSAVCDSLTDARRAGVISDGRIAVAAHRCSDRTESVARELLGQHHLVWPIEDPGSVGTIRSALIRRAVDVFGAPDWLLSTDADSQVPLRWAEDVVRLGADHDAVAGLVVLSELEPSSAIRTAHDRLVQAGISGPDRHDHVYAANLGVRWASYQQAGGFPDVRHGEERALLTGISSVGGRILTSTQLTVITSGRLAGRAAHGLHSVLAGLAGTPTAGS